MCESGNQEEHEACKENLGYCPYCEEALAYPESPTEPSITLVMQGQ